MVYVRLERDWTDPEGRSHSAGALVDVDAGTLAELEAEGIVAEPDGGWAGPSQAEPDGGWAGPSQAEPDGGWAGPSQAEPDGGWAGPSQAEPAGGWAGPSGGNG
jgi:hypothetical protein